MGTRKNMYVYNMNFTLLQTIHINAMLFQQFLYSKFNTLNCYANKSPHISWTKEQTPKNWIK